MAVALLPRMSNFTDFNVLAAEGDVALRYAVSPRDIEGADVVVLPGSKNTIADLEHLRRVGFDEVLMAHVDRGGELVGICGGYQMLGRVITDPYGVEAGGQTQGLGLLDVVTELLPYKRTVQVEALPLHVDALPDSLVWGYEIHMGRTRRDAAMPCFRVLRCIGQAGQSGDPAWQAQEALDGAIRQDRLVWGNVHPRRL